MEQNDQITFSNQISHTINMVRRKINDPNIDAPLFTDSEICDYIADAVDELELFLFKKGRYVDEGQFKDALTDRETSVPQPERTIYSIQASILIITAIKIKADRDNFALRKPTLSVDTSRQSSDHAETLAILKSELMSRIVGLVTSTVMGFRYSADEV